MKRKARNVWMLARALSRAPQPFLFEEDKGNGGGGGGDPPKMISEAEVQARIDKVLGQRLAEERKKYSDYDALKAEAAKKTEIEAELAKLREERETAGKSAEEVRKIEADRAAKQLERERNEATTKLTAAEQRAEAAEKRHRELLVSQGLGSALDGSKVLTTAREKAIRLMREDAQVELDDSGKITSVTYGGVAYKTPAEAASAFLKDNDFLASAGAPKGGGSSPPNAGGAGGKDVFKASADENFASGLAAPPKPIPGFTPPV